MTHLYPTAADLAAQGVTLQRDVCLWSDRLWREYYTTEHFRANIPAALLPKRERNHNRRKDKAPRTFASKYVGVTIHRDRWLAQWQHRGALKGRVFPLTPAGELQAATERARALGLDGPQMRA